MEDNDLLHTPTFAPKAVIAELKKVQWPTFKNLMSSSALVIVFTLLFGFYFFICEIAASGLVSWILSL
ncbi:MAG: preprotein translocase subunit SecE [Allobaculum sp.]